MSGLWPNGLRTKPAFTTLWKGYVGHNGLDMINFDINHAVLGGTVVTAGYSVFGGGYLVEILATNGDLHRYLHNLKGLFVRVGQVVVTGQALGYQGSTGFSTGKHLHFAVRKGGKWGSYVDPLPYVEALVGSTSASVSKTEPITDKELEELMSDSETRYVYKTEKGTEYQIIGERVPGGWEASTKAEDGEAYGVLFGTPEGAPWMKLPYTKWQAAQRLAKRLNLAYEARLKAERVHLAQEIVKAQVAAGLKG